MRDGAARIVEAEEDGQIHSTEGHAQKSLYNKFIIMETCVFVGTRLRCGAATSSVYRDYAVERAWI